jgi:hypothetical protein
MGKCMKFPGGRSVNIKQNLFEQLYGVVDVYFSGL